MEACGKYDFCNEIAVSMAEAQTAINGVIQILTPESPADLDVMVAPERAVVNNMAAEEITSGTQQITHYLTLLRADACTNCPLQGLND